MPEEYQKVDFEIENKPFNGFINIFKDGENTSISWAHYGRCNIATVENFIDALQEAVRIAEQEKYEKK